MSRRDRLAAPAVGAAALAFYLLASSYAGAYDDGLKEAGLAAAAGWGVRAYHLWQTAAYQLAIAALGGLGWGGPSFVPIQVLNSLCGAVAAAQVWLLLGRVGVGPAGRILGTAIWAVSADPLLHSRTGDTGMTPMPMVLGAWLLLLPRAIRPSGLPLPPGEGGGEGGCESRGDGGTGPGSLLLDPNVAVVSPHPSPHPNPLPEGEGVQRAFVAALFTSLGVLLSLNLVVLLPALLIGSVWHWQSAASGAPATAGTGGPAASGTPLPRSFWAALLALALGLGLPYLCAAWAGGHTTPGALWHWLTWHEDAKGLKAGGGLVTGVLRAVVGLGRLAFPGSAGETAVKAVLRHQAVRVSAWDWLTLARNLAAAGLIGLLPLLGWRRRRGTPAARLAGVAVLCTAVFNVIWLGSDPQYWLPVYPWLVAFAAVAVSGRGRRWARRALGAALVLWLAVTNLPSPTPTPLQPWWGPEYREAQRAAGLLPPGSLVVVPGNSPLRLLQELCPDVTVVDLTYSAAETLEGEAFTTWLDGRLDAALSRGGEVVIEDLTAPLPPEALGRWEMVAGTHRVAREELETRLQARYRLAPTVIGPDVLQVRRK